MSTAFLNTGSGIHRSIFKAQNGHLIGSNLRYPTSVLVLIIIIVPRSQAFDIIVHRDPGMSLKTAFGELMATAGLSVQVIMNLGRRTIQARYRCSGRF